MGFMSRSTHMTDVRHAGELPGEIAPDALREVLRMTRFLVKLLSQFFQFSNVTYSLGSSPPGDCP